MLQVSAVHVSPNFSRKNVFYSFLVLRNSCSFTITTLWQARVDIRCKIAFKFIMKGGTQGFPRHEVSDKQEISFRRRFAVYGIFNSSTQNAVDGETSSKQNFLFVAHFVSGKPLCPALHDITMRVSSKKSFTLLK